MSRNRILWIGILLLACRVSEAQDLLLVGGKLVDPRSQSIVEQNLLILNGFIAGRPAKAPADFAGEVVDVRGEWIIPGLHDLHTHTLMNLAGPRAREFVGTPKAARRMLYCGVTGFLDLFNTESYILRVRDEQRSRREGNGADIFAAGPCFTATAGHCTQFAGPARIIDTPEEARRLVAELATKKPDVIKLVYSHRQSNRLELLM